jgi:putative ABC transport system substrate-binding protein
MNARHLLRLRGSHEAPRVHHTARGRSGGMAARGARTADRKVADHRFPCRATPSAMVHLVTAFTQRLRELGWIEGRNIAIEHRWVEGWGERAATEVATELVRLKVTGLSNQSTDIAAKRLELLREVVPSLKRLAILANIASPASMLEMREVEEAARSLGLEVATLKIRQAGDISRDFKTIKGNADALLVTADPLINSNRVRINTLAIGARLPTIYNFRDSVEMAGLMSYGPNLPDLFRRVADYADKILRGAKPGDIPVEQPTKFDLVLNLITAQALGLTVPPTLLARADEVIE